MPKGDLFPEKVAFCQTPKRSPFVNTRKGRLRFRWLKSLCSFRVKLMVDPIPELDFRRLQIPEQQAEKQRKNPLQKTMIFGRRAAELVLLEPGLDGK